MLGFIKDIFKPAHKLIDELIFSGEEKAAAKLKAQELQASLRQGELSLYEKSLNLVREKMQAQARVIEVESKGNQLQRSWRPITMLCFTAILVSNYVAIPWLNIIFGAEISLIDFPAPFWTLLTIGIGGYISSRGGEKMLATWKGQQPI